VVICYDDALFSTALDERRLSTRCHGSRKERRRCARWKNGSDTTPCRKVAALFMSKQPSPKNDKPHAPDARRISLDHVFPEGQRTLFSNHITVQRNEVGEFVVSFFDVIAPLLIGGPDESEKALTKLDSVPAYCVARIAVSERRLPKLIGALASSYDEFVASQNTGQTKPEGKNKKHAS